MGFLGTSLVVQWLRLPTSSAGGLGSIPDQGTMILHAMLHSQKKKKKAKNTETRYGINHPPIVPLHSLQSVPSPSFLEPLICFLLVWFCLKFHISDIIQYGLALYVCLFFFFSFSIVLLRSIHMFLCICSFFLLINSKPLSGYTTIFLFVH